jgi:hypothetical protein
MKDYHETVVQPTPQTTEYRVLQSVNRISLLVGGIVFGAMLFDGHSVTTSMLAGVGFYAIVAALLILTPYVTALFIAYMQEVTIRRRDDLPYRYAETQRVQVVDQPRIGYTATTDPIQLPVSPSYIPAVPRVNDTTRLDAMNFINQLFDGDGRPLPNKITKNKGQIQHKSPTPEAIEYLASLNIVRSGTGSQLYYDLSTYPTHREAINALRTGVIAPWQGQGKEEAL